jgi:hypothetical protein
MEGNHEYLLHAYFGQTKEQIAPPSTAPTTA